MKKLLLALPLVLAMFLFVGCEEDATTEPVASTTGGVYLKTTPAGAKIYVDGVLSTKVTPALIDNLTDGKSYTFTLSYTDYDSATVVKTAAKGKVDTVATTLMTKWLVFTSDTIWESNATGKSGLSLKLGKVFSATAAFKDSVDLYYRSGSYRVVSADTSSTLSRATRFKIGSAALLTDGVDSPVKDASWLHSFGDREANYIFAYDAESHYSKIVIDKTGGGTVGNPAWMKVKWYYRTKVNATDF